MNFLSQYKTNEGTDLQSLSEHSYVMLVFLRRFGCTFCREAMSDLSRIKTELEQMRVKLVLVHMTSPDDGIAEEYFERYNLKGVSHVGDPTKKLYQQFGLKRGTFSQLYGLSTWVRGYQAGVVDGHGWGSEALADGFQMPGVFLIRDGQVEESYVHKSVSDRPEYLRMLDCCRI